MTDKPTALRLADDCDEGMVDFAEVATELRRLHALNAELLEALEDVMDRLVDRHETDEAAVVARAAIARAEELL